MAIKNLSKGIILKLDNGWFRGKENRENGYAWRKTIIKVGSLVKQ